MIKGGDIHFNKILVFISFLTVFFFDQSPTWVTLGSMLKNHLRHILLMLHCFKHILRLIYISEMDYNTFSADYGMHCIFVRLQYAKNNSVFKTELYDNC